jgi:hypothetical protein
VFLNAAAVSGSIFTGWGPVGDCSGLTCSVIMGADKSVTANFAPTFNLTVATSGNGSGSVGVFPAGTTCGVGCYSYASGTSVTLTAAAASGSSFTGWSGACSGSGGCLVTMSTSQSVSANFDLAATPNPMLTVAVEGTGLVFSLDAGINCGPGAEPDPIPVSCSATFAAATTVTLAATPAPGGSFVGWFVGSDTSPASTSVTFTILVDAVKTVKAKFNP